MLPLDEALPLVPPVDELDEDVLPLEVLPLEEALPLVLPPVEDDVLPLEVLPLEEALPLVLPPVDEDVDDALPLVEELEDVLPLVLPLEDDEDDDAPASGSYGQTLFARTASTGTLTFFEPSTHQMS